MSEYSTTEGALEELRQDKIILITDDEDRESGGDFICTAGFTTTKNASLMAVRGKGLICMPISRALCQKLQFPQTVSDNKDNHEMAFAVSVDHTSIITGTSTAERSITVMKCAEENAKPEDFHRPDHMFPLTAKKNGVLERNGHAEATVNLIRLTGSKECGLCCEVMREDGAMMRVPELMELAEKRGPKMITIEALQGYRKRNDKLVEQVACASLPTEYGDFRIYGYIDELNGEHHVALVKREIDDGRSLLYRVHSEYLADGVFGFECCDCGQQFAAAMAQIEKEGRGILLYIRQEGRGIGLINKLHAYALRDQGMNTLGVNLALGFSGDLREYFIGAQVLRDLGARTLRLFTNNPDRVYWLSGFGMEVVQRIPVQTDATTHDLSYLETKQEKTGHLLNF